MTISNQFRKSLALGLLPLALLLAACGGSAGSSAPAAAAPTVKTLFISADVVQGSTNVPKDLVALNSCVLSSRFPRNSQMVWRSRVFDPATGNLMDDKAISKVTVSVVGGKSLDAVYGLHPKTTGEGFWTASWIVPKDQPTGTLKYSIAATAIDGRTGEFQPFSTAASLPSILDQVLPDQPAS